MKSLNRTTRSSMRREPRSAAARLGLATALTALALVGLFAPAAHASKQAMDFFGGNGTLGGQFSYGSGGVAVNDTGAGPADQGDVYAVDSQNNRIERFGRDDNGTPGNTPAATADDTYFFISAWGADVDSTPSAGSDYEICTVAADCQAGLASAGNGTAAGNGDLDSSPSRASIIPSIALDQDTGNLNVSDYNNYRINVYAGDGTFLRSFGYDVVASGPDNAGTGYEVCVAASGDVCKAGLSGSAAGQIGVDPFYGDSGARGIAVSAPDGNPATATLFLADSANRRIDTYALDGTGPSSFGSAVQFPAHPYFHGASQQPTAIAVDSRGIVYIGAGGGGGPGDGDFRIERYDSQNADGDGVGFLAPIPSPQNEEQTLAEEATAGTFRLTFGGQTTQTDLPFDAGPSQIRPALEALSSIGPGNVSVQQGNTGVQIISISFSGALANTDLEQLTLSNGTTPLTGSIPVKTIFNGHLGLAPHAPVFALAVDPDTDGAGPDTDVLYAERGNQIQQFGPLNPAGLTAPPTATDDVHGTSGANQNADGLAIEPSTGRLYADANGTAGSGLYVLDQIGPPPSATMDSVDGITAHGADLHATIDPNGPPATRYHFEYVDDAAFQADDVNELQIVTLSAAVGGTFTLSFEGHTTAPISFNASAATVQAELEALSSIGPGNVAVSGPAGGPYSVEFKGLLAHKDVSQLQAGDALTPPAAGVAVTTASNGGDGWKHAAATPEQFLGAQPDPQAVSRHLQPGLFGLDPNTAYHVRVVAGRRFAAPVISNQLTFPTPGAPPLAETTGAPVRTTTTAQLNGRVTPLGTATGFHFEYGSAGPCDANPCVSTPTLSAGAGQLTRFVGAGINGLVPATTYHYRLLADNGVGAPVAGDDMTVTTRSSDQLPGQSDQFPGPPGSDRAWELVSRPDTSGNPATTVFFPAGFSDDGNRAFYSISGGTPISTTGFAANPHYAERTPSGWQTTRITPERDQLAGGYWSVGFASQDLSTMLTTNTEQFGGGSGQSQIWRLNPGSSPSLLLQLPAAQLGPDFGLSADGSRTLATLIGQAFDPQHPTAAGQFNLYDLGSATPELASLLPGDLVGPCGIALHNYGGNGAIGFRPSHWVADDGSYVLFEAQPTPPCFGAGETPAQLYLRDLLADQTKLISAPPVSGPACPATLINATSTAVFFTTSTRLDPADTEPADCTSNNGDGPPDGPSNDVYRYDLGSGALECVTCVIPGFDVGVWGQGPLFVNVSDDGSRVYFVSKKRLLPGAPDGQFAIYRIDVEAHLLAYVAPFNFEGSLGSIGPYLPRDVASPDGSTFAFSSNLTALNPVGGLSDNGGTRQFYRYDDADRSLICVTCPQDGSPPLADLDGDLNNLPKSDKGLNNTGNLSADGATLAFTTVTPLLAADQNTGPPDHRLSGDDVYEWRDGRLLLVTDGQSSSELGVNTLGISPSGNDIFFNAAAAYTPDAPDAQLRFYDARIGGGFHFPPPGLPPCNVDLSECERAGTSAPDRPGAGSAAFQGPGDQGRDRSPKPRCRKGKVRRHGRCVAKKHHHAHHHRRAQR